MITHDKGRLFCAVVPVKRHAPPLWLLRIRQSRYPYMRSIAVMVRWHWRKAAVAGVWLCSSDRLSESQLLLRAISRSRQRHPSLTETAPLQTEGVQRAREVPLCGDADDQ